MSSTLLETERFRVKELSIVDPGGKTHRRAFVEHPGAAVILPLLDDGRIVMIRNRRHAIDQTLWELPAGTLEAGEAPLRCAERELQEETGYAAGSLTPLCTFYSSPGICTELMHTFVARDLQPAQTLLDPTETIDVQPQSKQQLDALLKAGDIRDAKTLATLLYYRFTEVAS